MNFTIYTLGDLSSMTAILNAVAMIFNDPILNESGALGGSAVRLVFLGVLAAVLLGGMTTLWRNGQGSPTIMLTVFVLWISLGFTKATVTVVDLYSGSAATVDNVPLLVAVPGGVFTEVGQALGEKMQAAFSSADASAPALSTTGFVNPLTYILSLRRVMASGMQPHVYNSLRYYAADCVLASDQAPSDIFESYRTLHELLDDDTYHDGFTSVFTNAYPRGTLASCLEASGYLKDNMTAWASVPFATPANNMLKAGMGNNILRGAGEMGKAAVLSSGGGLGGAAIIPPTSMDSSNVGQVLLDGLGRTSMAAASDVAAISASLAFLPGFSDGLMCGTPSPGITMADVNSCSLMSSDQDELARLIESARGGGFGRVAISSMGVFQAIWVALAPLMILTILAHGSRGPQIFGAYLLLGLWVVSWLPVAYVVNYYIDLSFRQAVAQLGGSGATFNLSQVYSLYRVAADKISVASDLMGAVPVLTMAILTGSVYAMTKVAGTTMPRPEGFNAQAGHMTAATSHQGLGLMAARFQQNGMSAASGESFVKAGVQQDSVDVSTAAQHRTEHAARIAQGAEQQFSRAVESSVSTESGMRRTESKGWDLASSYTKTLGKSRESSEAVGREILNNLGFKEEAKDSAKAQATGSLALQAGIGVLGNQASAAMLGQVIKGRDLSAAEAKDLSERLSNSKAWKDTWKEGYEARGTLSDTQRQSLDKTTGLSETDRDAIQRGYKETRAAQESLQNAASFASTLGVGGKTTASTLAAGLSDGEVETFGRIADLARSYQKDPARKRMLDAEFGGDSAAAQRFATQYGVLQNRAVSYGGQGFIASSRNRAALAEMAFIQSGDLGERFSGLLEQSQRNQIFLGAEKIQMPNERQLNVAIAPNVEGPKGITVGNADLPIGGHLDPGKTHIAPLAPKPSVDAVNGAAERTAAAGGIPTSDPHAGRERLDAVAKSNEKRLKDLKVSGAQLTPEQIKDVGGSLTTQYSGMFDGVEGGWDNFATKNPAVAATMVAALEVAPIAKGAQLLRGAKMAAAGGDAAYTAAKNVTKDQGIITDLTQRMATITAKNGGIRTPEVMKLERDIAGTAKNMAEHLKVLGGEGAKKGSMLGAETTKELNRSFNTLATLGAAYDAHQIATMTVGSGEAKAPQPLDLQPPAARRSAELPAGKPTVVADVPAGDRGAPALVGRTPEGGGVSQNWKGGAAPAVSAIVRTPATVTYGSEARKVGPDAVIKPSQSEAGLIRRDLEGAEQTRAVVSPPVFSSAGPETGGAQGGGLRYELPSSGAGEVLGSEARALGRQPEGPAERTSDMPPIARADSQTKAAGNERGEAQHADTQPIRDEGEFGDWRVGQDDSRNVARKPDLPPGDPTTRAEPPPVSRETQRVEPAKPVESFVAEAKPVMQAELVEQVRELDDVGHESRNSSVGNALGSDARALGRQPEGPAERTSDMPPIARADSQTKAAGNERGEAQHADTQPIRDEGQLGDRRVGQDDSRNLARKPDTSSDEPPPVQREIQRVEPATPVESSVAETRRATQAEPVQQVREPGDMRQPDGSVAAPASSDAITRIEQLAMNVETAVVRADNASSQAVAAADRAAAASNRAHRGGTAPVKSESNPPTPVASGSRRTMRDIVERREEKPNRGRR